MRALKKMISQPVLCIYWTFPEAPENRCDEKQLRDLLLFSYRYTPSLCVRWGAESDSGVSEAEALFLDFADLSEERRNSFLEDFDEYALKLGLKYQLGVGSEPSAAILHALYSTQKFENLPLDTLWHWLQPFRPAKELKKEFDELIFNLYRRGLQTVQDFQNLPPETLSDRFGMLVAHLKNKIDYRSDTPWPKFRIEESIVESVAFGNADQHGACTEVEPLLFLLKQIFDQTFKRLQRLDLRMSAIEIRFKLDTHADSEFIDRRWAIELALPQSKTSAVLPLVREKIALEIQNRPLEHAVIGIEVRILDTAPGDGNQKNFFHRKEEEAEQFDELIHRLVQRIGTQKVFRAQRKSRHLPEKAWGRAAWGSKKANGDLPIGQQEAKALSARPLRLLSHPTCPPPPIVGGIHISTAIHRE